jgi:hypothetical protein
LRQTAFECRLARWGLDLASHQTVAKQNLTHCVGRDTGTLYGGADRGTA